uniref:Baseplate wedge protein n=1 Tax=Serratia phage Kevin TaxID=3161161 RepID=A0AAU8KZ54_9CAUD
MNYFENFPLIWHTLVNDGDMVLLANITQRVMVSDKIRNIEGILMTYQISDDETPRQFAERVYGSFELFWIPLIINKIFDVTNEWPRPVNRIGDELVETYGVDGMWETKHYVNEFGIVTDPRALRYAYNLGDMPESNIIANYGLTPVSYHDYYMGLNEAKQSIQVLNPDYVTVFVNQLEQELKNG